MKRSVCLLTTVLFLGASASALEIERYAWEFPEVARIPKDKAEPLLAPVRGAGG